MYLFKSGCPWLRPLPRLAGELKGATSGVTSGVTNLGEKQA